MPDAFKPVEEEKLLNFVLAFYSESDLTLTLAKLGYDVNTEGVFGQGRSKRDNFNALRQAAIRNDWGTLFAFCVVANLFHKREAEQLAESLFSSMELEGFRLYETLEYLDVKAELLAKAYQEVKPDMWASALPPKAAESRMSVALSICRAEEAARDKPILYEFTREVARSLDDGGRKRLGEWWETAKLRHGLQGDLTQSKGEVSREERYSVIVELREAGSGTAQPRSWMRQSWLYRHHTAKFEPLDTNNAPATLATIPAYLSEIRDQLGRQHVPVERVTFEFFVSRPSLNCGADQWLVPIDVGIESALGHEHPVVIRYLDRKHATRDKVRERWQRLLAIPSLVGAAAVAVVTRGHGGEPNEIYQQFNTSPDMLCLVVDGPFPDPPDFKKYACVAAALAAGVPLIIWAREAEAADALKTQVAEILAGPPVLLPDNVRKVRRDLEKKLGKHVTLFFEFGDHWLPESEPLTVPK
jgi:hypothetical protein